MAVTGMSRWSRIITVVIFGTSLGAAPGNETSLAGRWDAVVVANGVDVPFRFEIVADGSSLKGSFFNGERRITSKPGRVEDGVLLLSFDQYAATLRATVTDGRLEARVQARQEWSVAVPRGARVGSTARGGDCAIDRGYVDRQREKYQG